MIGSELVALGFGHRAERVVCSSKLALEGIACLNNLLLNFVALLASYSWAKREVSEVTTNTNSSRLDHRGIFSREWRALKLGVVHV